MPCENEQQALALPTKRWPSMPKQLCRWTGTLSVLQCFFFWLLACFSDAGVVTQCNVAAWNAAHPCEHDLLFPPKRCTTCDHDRPARCRHCSLCKACIARHDHHCGWVNNCIGAGNLRWFLAFLAANGIMMTYGSVLAGLTMIGHLELRGAWAVKITNPVTGKERYLYQSWSDLLTLCGRQYPVHCMLVLFLGIAALILWGFLTYQIWVVSIGLTGTEVHKIKAAKQQGVDVGKLRQLRVQYNRGLFRNWIEVLCPEQILKRHQKLS